MSLFLKFIFNCLTRILVFSNRSKKRISCFHGLHESKTIYILASGPSLIGQSLDFLQSQIVIAVNGSYSALEPKLLSHLYWVMADPKRLNVFSAVDRSQFSQSFCYLTPNGSFINPLSLSSLDIVLPALRRNSFKHLRLGNTPFPPDLTSGSFSSGAGSSVFNAIELALYFGAYNIVLLGCDFQVPPTGPSHFVEYQLTLPSGLAYSELISEQFSSKIRPALQFYNSYCQINGVKMYNASTSTADDLTPKLSFDNLPLK